MSRHSIEIQFMLRRPIMPVLYYKLFASSAWHLQHLCMDRSA